MLRICIRLALAAAVALSLAAVPAAGADRIRVISFNIQFIGSSPDRRNEDLADMLAPFDLVIVQEVIAPPYAGTFPDGTPFRPEPKVAAFFDAMKARRFDFVMSEEDTGPGATNHNNGTATEWFVAFYKPSALSPANRLPHGFLARDRTKHPDYQRVPYAFAFKASNADLVFISVHLEQGASEKARRAHELSSIFAWIAGRPGRERDYIVLGDMNFENCAELNANLPSGRASLNGTCQATNTNPRGPKPYDHVIYDTAASTEIVTRRGFTVIDLVDEMKRRWPAGTRGFPGNPYDRDRFRALYSDHHPIRFSVRTDERDDD